MAGSDDRVADGRRVRMPGGGTGSGWGGELPGADTADAMTTLSPGPPSRMSWPGPPIRTSSPAPPSRVSLPCAADQDVVAVAAVGGELDRAGRQARGLDHVVAGQGVDDQPVVGRLGAGDVHLGGQAEHRDAARVAGDADDVVAVGAVDDDGVGRAVAGAAAGVPARLRLTSVTSVPDRSLTVIVSAPPRALKSIRLDVVEVHGDVGDVAGEARRGRRWPRCRSSR